MFDNENENLNNITESSEAEIPVADPAEVPEVESTEASVAEPTQESSVEPAESPVVETTSEVVSPKQQPEVLNLGFENRRVQSDTTPTYYKRPEKKTNVFAVCLISVLATLSICLIGLFVLGWAVSDDHNSNAINQQNTESTHASTLEQLAKKEGSEMSIVDIANKVGPAVCGITVTQQVQSFFGTQLAEGSGSGIIISEDGYIVTNQHVIENASEIKVILSSGQEYTAQLVGQDANTDLAVIKIDGDNFPVAELGYSGELAVGELAIAIGNPLGQEFAGSVTVGVISALNRSVTVEDRTYTLIQTDAAINSGNSGGALVNSFGQVVGINSLKALQAEGLGFAIPIDFAKPIIDDLMANGYVKGRPVIGVSLREVDSSMSQQYGVPEGLYVVSVTPFSAAEKAGVIQGDVILEADGQKVSTVAELNAIKNQKRAGDTIKLKIKRSNNNDFMGKWSDKTIDLVLGEEIPAP